MMSSAPSVDRVPLQYSLGYSLRRSFVDEFYARHIRTLPAGSRVLDLGGYKFRKRGAFDIASYPVRVTYANLSRSQQPDVQTDAASLPCKSECFDAVVCSELLEHVDDPKAVLQEMYRVLKPTGVCLISVPFLFHIHADPCDYGRYTDHYWRMQLQKLGFDNINIEAQGLFWSVAIEMLRAWFYERVKQGRLQSAVLQRLITALVAKGRQAAFRREQRVEAFDHAFIKRYTTGYGIRVVRP
jgi:ubiquinone/menaquinone biosynthesis C-methylase UbiE